MPEWLGLFQSSLPPEHSPRSLLVKSLAIGPSPWVRDSLCLTYHIGWHSLNLLFGEIASHKSPSSCLLSPTTLCINCVSLNPLKANAKVGLKMKEPALAGMAQLVGALSWQPKGCRFIPAQGTYLGSWFDPWSGSVQEATGSVSPSLPLSLSLKAIKKMSSGECKKKTQPTMKESFIEGGRRRRQ